MTEEKRIRNQPWYKERLKTKYLKSLKAKEISKTLVGKNWVLLKNGLDDFRDGLPPVTDGNFIIQHKNTLGSNIVHKTQAASLKALSRKAPRFTKHQICYSIKFPLAEERWNKLELLEYSLLQHPLALFPHLEKCVDPKVFIDIVNITDPEIYCSASPNLSPNNPTLGTTPEHKKNACLLPEIRKPPKIVVESEPIDSFLTKADTPSGLKKITEVLPADNSGNEKEKKLEELDKETIPGSIEEQSVPRFGSVGAITKDGELIRNPYRWLAKTQGTKDKKRKDRKSDRQDDHVKKVTKEFSEWVSSLGGENNMDESTITALFTSSYESKPAMSVPIEIVELSNVPQELHMSNNIYQQTNQFMANTPHNKRTRPPWTMFQEKRPERPKFGAWYIPVKLWKKETIHDQMKDPKEMDNAQLSEKKKMSLALDTKLSLLHCSRAFLAWVEKKGNRKPEFLKEIAMLQKQKKPKEESDKEENGRITQCRSEIKSNLTKYSDSPILDDLSDSK